MNQFHMKHFHITYYHGPTAEEIIKNDTIADIAAAGFTLIPLHYDTETNKKALKIMNYYGIKAMVSDPRLCNVYTQKDFDSVDSVISEIASNYAEFDRLILGWDITDEPNAADFPILGAIIDAVNRITPGKEAYINLLPNYAIPEQLGTQDYSTYLEEFVNTVKPHTISYDHYHFLGREHRKAIMNLNVDDNERLIRLAAEQVDNRGGFFENIEEIRKIGLKYNIDAMLIVLLTEHGPYRNLTYAELLWEVNMCLAYGFKRLSYFTYWEPAPDEHWQWAHAMVNRKGNKEQHYYDVQLINALLLTAGQYLFREKSEAVFHIGEPDSGAQRLTEYDGITVDGENGVISFFTNGYIYLVNRNYVLQNTFTLNTDKPIKKLVHGIFEDADSNTFKLAAGEGVLLKI